MPDDKTWPGFSSTPFATKVPSPELVVHQTNRLRELFPEATLSKEGFEVLAGLLTCNPGKRLTADAALKHMWFAKVDALELPRKVEVTSALPSWKKKVPAACAKRRKLQSVPSPPFPSLAMAACVEAAPAAAAPAGLKRRRIAVGSTEQYEEETTCCLGKGAFGAVVKARHRATGQTVAIKRLGAGHGGGPEALLREARFHEDACGGGANPFIVGFRGVVRVPATFDLRLVMECVGPSLHDLLRQRPRGSPPLPEATVRAAMWQLLTGAKKMHGAHIVHRDIKPQNILVGDGHSVVKICDFGLAMSTDVRPPYELAGTLWYMAPEMLLEKPDYDAQVDIWSLGCVMAELINNGRPLFQGFYDQGQLSAIFEVLGMPDDSTWPWFSSTTFATVVMPELDRHPDNRLREEFPEAKLSKEGFEVLSGLLTCNPEKRLTAAAALKHPWFSKVDALELPKKVEVLSPLPKRRRLRAVCVA
ncbi:putative cyclin-dependent kinase F-2 [Dichanthelium oligosanthes]|uniref:[RNA-polymerase]-subunit kinase n=1 Tax=Dichanthelium oligosanthes TaxID=888268 RepID=A0A1E5VMD2_9POAL|nr:putative cyclin-dependent kinase F-2 [Dichanthelium oligosanthes]